MYLILVGAGDIGSEVVDVARQEGHEVVVVEQDQQTAEEIKSAYDVMVINGDGARRPILKEANPPEADALISTTESDAVNLMTMMMARELGIPNRLSVVHDPSHMVYFEDLDAHIMENPQQLIAKRLVEEIESRQT